MAGETLKPATAGQLRDAVRWAAAEEAPLEVVARGTKRGLGRPPQAKHALDVSALAGIASYEPEELVLTAAPATPMAEIDAALAAKGQMLAFEPPHFGTEPSIQPLPLQGEGRDGGGNNHQLIIISI